MGSHDTTRKRKAWRRPRRKLSTSPRSPPLTEPIKTTYSYEFKSADGEEVSETIELMNPKLIGTLKELAVLVWEPEYQVLFDLVSPDFRQ